MFLSFAFTQIPELSTNNSPFKSSDPIKNLRKRGRVSIASDIWSLSFGDFWSRVSLEAIGQICQNEPVSAESHVVAEKVFGSEVSLIAHLAGPVPLTRGPGARSKRARLTSPELTRVDRAPCSPTPSGAFSLRRPPRAPPRASTPGGAPFHPSRFSRTCREAMGRVALEGRAPPTRRTIRTDAPGPPNPSVIPSGTPRSSHDRRRTSSGPRAPRRGVRPVPKLFPRPTATSAGRGRLSFFSALAPLALPRGRALRRI